MRTLINLKVSGESQTFFVTTKDPQRIKLGNPFSATMDFFAITEAQNLNLRECQFNLIIKWYMPFFRNYGVKKCEMQ